MLSKLEILEKIGELLKNHKVFTLPNIIKNNYKELFNDVVEYTNFLKDDVKLSERIYCIKNNITEAPKCKQCNINNVKFRINNNTYSDFCSIKCSASSKLTVEKRKKSSREKYGENNYMNRQKAQKTLREKLNNKEYKEKFIQKNKQTKLERYGDENYANRGKRFDTEIKKYGKLFLQTDLFKQKAKNTKLERYGDENFVNIEQARLTKLEKHGFINFFNYEKCKQTKLERYGDEQYNNSNKIRETKQNFSDEKNKEINLKREQTNLQKFGVKYVTQSPEFQEKIKLTCIEKYGVRSTLQIDSCKENNKKIIFEKTYNNLKRFSEYVIPLFSLEDYIGNTADHIYEWKCVKCGDIFKYRYNNGVVPRCLKCFPFIKSQYENEIISYIKSFYDGNIIQSNRNLLPNYELDIVIPEKKIAIEFNGLFWHSEFNGMDKNYHLNKTELCKKQGYRLIHIFEDEWIYREKTVKSKLKHLLGLTKYKIYARNCTIKAIETDLKDKFLEKYHIQGNDISLIKLGAFYKTHLVGVMTFGKLRKALGQDHEEGSFELLRFATINNFNIIGIADKLLKHFERSYTPNKIISYADRRWSEGNVYLKLGFMLNHISKPNYWYYRKNECKRYHRFNFRKDVLKDKLANFDENLTEVENMTNNGWSRIWDCGNLVFVKEY